MLASSSQPCNPPADTTRLARSHTKSETVHTGGPHAVVRTPSADELESLASSAQRTTTSAKSKLQVACCFAFGWRQARFSLSLMLKACSTARSKQASSDLSKTLNHRLERQASPSSHALLSLGTRLNLSRILGLLQSKFAQLHAASSEPSPELSSLPQKSIAAVVQG